MKSLKKKLRATTGIFISKEMLSQAKIDTDELILELGECEVRIRAFDNKANEKVLTSASPLWECVGIAQVEHVNGRDHDQFIYCEK